MAKVTIYSKQTCPFCRRAKGLLKDLGQKYTEIDILEHPEKRAEMIEKANGGKTVPQIFIDGKHVGGCDDLHDLHNDGKLKPLLNK